VSARVGTLISRVALAGRVWWFASDHDTDRTDAWEANPEHWRAGVVPAGIRHLVERSGFGGPIDLERGLSWGD
jgi:hypothetical protein